MAQHKPHPYPDAIAPDSRLHPEPPPPPPGMKLPIPPLATPLASLAAKDFGSSVPPKPQFWAWLAATVAGWAAFAVALLVVSWVLYFIVWLFKTIFQDRPNLAGGVGEAIGNIVALILVLIMVTATLLTMAERKWSALMQDRIGPNRARLPIPGLSERPLKGIPHILADVLKMLFKEDFIPEGATRNKFLFNLAPLLAFAPAFCLFAVVPVGPEVTFLGKRIALQGPSEALLLSAMRTGGSADGTLVFGWLPGWGALFQPLGMILFLVAAMAEIKRAPFDTPEGESEIIGYFLEYSGLKSGLFLIAEFAEVVVVSGIVTAIFLGGYHIPWFEPQLVRALGLTGLAVLQVFTFLVKMLLLIWVQMLARWAFPRFRFDQIMRLGWKMMLPVSLANVVLSAGIWLWAGREGLAWMGILEWAALLGFIALSAGAKESAEPGSHTSTAAAH